MAETLQMTFRNELGRMSTISIADPDPELTGEDITPVMDSVIDKNIFDTTGGDLVEKVRAQVVTRTVDVLEEY